MNHICKHDQLDGGRDRPIWTRCCEVAFVRHLRAKRPELLEEYLVNLQRRVRKFSGRSGPLSQQTIQQCIDAAYGR